MQMVTHTGTNRARCRVSVFIRWMSLTAYYGPVSVCTLSIRLSKATTVRIRVTHCCTCRLAFYLYCGQLNWPVVWHCWLGVRKGTQSVKNWVVVCLEQDVILVITLLMAQLMPLPLTVSFFSKIQSGFTFLVPAHLGSPGQRAIKWVHMCVSASESFMQILCT